MSWQLALLLPTAIAAEMRGTTALRLSQGFTHLGPRLVVLIGCGASIYLLDLALERGLEMGIAFAIWSGLGMVTIVLIGLPLFQKKLNLGR